MYQHKSVANKTYITLILGIMMAILSVSGATQGQEIERLEVTGSHIKRTDFEVTQPIQVLERKKLLASGFVSVAEVLNNLTIGTAAINTQSNNGGDGSSRLSMRNLGAARVLVLVNGRRWINSGGSVDLNGIPVSVIKQIEILKDGAAAIYGSDAIAGVVNVITRDDFHGLELTGYYGIAQKGDGAKEQYDLSIGQSWDIGSLYFNTSYTKTKPIWAGERNISKLPQYGTGNTQGSSGTPQGRFTFPTKQYGIINYSIKKDFDWHQGNPTPPTLDTAGNLISLGDFVPWHDDLRYNYAPENYLRTPQDRWSSFIQGKYFLTEYLNLTTEVLYNHRESSQLLAPMPLFIGPLAGGNESLNPTLISKDNIYNPFKEDIFGPNTPSNEMGIIGRRMIENGHRIFTQQLDTWRFTAVLEGKFKLFEQDWLWDIHYSYAQNAGIEMTQGRMNRPRIRKALSAACNTDPDCVPLNLFGGQGSITPAQLTYISTIEHNTFGDSLRNYAVNLSGSLYELPAGQINLAVGWEYRRESAFNSPDYMVQSGQSTGGQRLATDGAFSENAYYSELIVPLVTDSSWMKYLGLELALRQTTLENTATLKDTNTSGKIAIQYNPTSELLFRSTWSQGFRSPTIGNLFGGLSTVFPSVTDPCTLGGQNLSGCTGVPATYQQPNNQLEGQVGSNSALKPETSTNVSAGVVYAPSWVKGLDIAIDYWDIKIKDVITRAGFQQVLDTCAGVSGSTTHPVKRFCQDLLVRSPSGIPHTLINPWLNLGELNTSGLDISLNYRLETDMGDFKFMWDNTYTRSYHLTNYLGVQSKNYVGKNFGDAGYPKWKSNLVLSWQLNNWQANLTSRFISNQREDCNRFSQYPDLCSGYESVTNTTNHSQQQNWFLDYGNYFVQDVQVSYDLPISGSRLSVGINNIYNKQPPVSVLAFANSFDVNQFDGTGRYFYARFTMKF